MGFVVVVLIIGLIPATIAKNKGHSFLLWWLFGMALWIVAMPCAICLKNTADVDLAGKKKCPSCAELVKLEAAVCKHCHYSFFVHTGQSRVAAPYARPTSDWPAGS